MRRNLEIFSAGCPLCSPLVELVNELADNDDTVTVLSTQDPAVAERASVLGIKTLPALSIDGKLASCCSSGGYNKVTLTALIAS